MSLISPNTKIIALDTVEASHGGNTSRVVVKSILIPANTFKAGDVMKITYVTSIDATQTYYTLTYLNTSPTLTGATTIQYISLSANMQKQTREYFIEDANTMNVFQTNLNTQKDGTFDATAYVPFTTLDFTVDQYFMLAVQCAVDGARTMTCRGIIIERIRE